MSGEMDERKGGPIVAFANWLQFGANERLMRPYVESRMLLWCVAGNGRLWVNGDGWEFQPGSWALLPWRHQVVYEPDAVAPFLVGGIHLIPWHADTPVIFQVAHTRADPLSGDPSRADRSWKNMDGLIKRQFALENDRLAMLASYTVERFQHAKPTSAAMRSLAMLLIDEIGTAVESGSPLERPKPASLRRMQGYVQTRMDRLLTVADLAQLANCSPASVHRLFRDFEATSPVRWMARLRAQRATFLLRTTLLSVREVGEQVGLTDPFHFSRFFKRETGVSPRAYQKSHQFI